MMKRSNFFLFFLFFLLVGCQDCKDFVVGLVGDPGKPSKTNTNPQYLPGKGYQCTTNEQCGDDLVCYHQDDSYVGVCAKVSY